MNIQDLLVYDQWATGVVLGQVETLTTEQFVQEFAGELSSVRQQAAHLVSVPDRYRARMMGEPVPDVSPASFASAAELSAYNKETGARMASFAASLTPERLMEVIRHETRSGLFILTVEQTLMHVVNHGTFHRGQLALLLKLHGLEPTNTDFILWPGCASS